MAQNQNCPNWLLIPVEIMVREFWGKLLVSCVAAETGFDVLLGRGLERAQLNYLPRGIFFDKAVNNKRPQTFEHARRLGNKIVAFDDEGLIYLSEQLYQKRISPKAMNHVSSFFCWGDDQARLISSKVPDAAGKILVTGNPRVDILRREFRGVFAEEANRLRNLYGPFFLINTNFSWSNHFYKTREELIENLKRIGTISTYEEANFLLRYSRYEDEMRRHFVAMVPVLSRAFPNKTIIVRPHPSENHTVWKSDFTLAKIALLTKK
ncbi:MAG: hypothetical protein L0331_16595 [Chloroflexi bacterium]|nr:hypothetical protein [Chloroflexota bacterium]